MNTIINTNEIKRNLTKNKKEKSTQCWNIRNSKTNAKWHVKKIISLQEEIFADLVWNGNKLERQLKKEVVGRKRTRSKGLCASVRTGAAQGKEGSTARCRFG